MKLASFKTEKIQLFLGFIEPLTVFAIEDITIPYTLEEWAVNNIDGTTTAGDVLSLLTAYLTKAAEDKHKYDYNLKEFAKTLYLAQLHNPKACYTLIGNVTDATI